MEEETTLGTINIQKLRGMGFPIKAFSAYGECIVVPGDKFDPDWDMFLGDQGHDIHETKEDGKPVTLVELIAKDQQGVKTTIKTSLDEKVEETIGEVKKATENLRRDKMRRVTNEWKPQEDELLLKRLKELGPRMKLSAKCKELAKEFPGRSPGALNQRFYMLAGKTQKKRKYEKADRRSELVKESLKNVCTTCGLPKDLCCCDKTVPVILKRMEEHFETELGQIKLEIKGMVETLGSTVLVVDKLSCQAIMQALETKAAKGQIAIPPGLYVHYGNALLEKDPKYCNIFREKVDLVLNACS